MMIYFLSQIDNKKNVAWFSIISLLLGLMANANAATEDQEAWRWPEGLVFYSIKANVPQQVRHTLSEAIKEIHRHTNIRFIDRADYARRFGREPPVYIKMTSEPGAGCYSKVGRILKGGGQELSLEGNCVSRRNAIHELIHAVGFGHEYERPDRETYIEIREENFSPKVNTLRERAAREGGRVPFTIDRRLRVRRDYPEYDYESIMNDNPLGNASRAPGKEPVMVSRDPRRPIRFEDRLSAGDIYMLNSEYNCANTWVGKWDPRNCKPAIRPKTRLLPMKLSIDNQVNAESIVLKHGETKRVKVYVDRPVYVTYRLPPSTVGLTIQAHPDIQALSPFSQREEWSIQADARFNTEQKIEITAHYFDWNNNRQGTQTRVLKILPATAETLVDTPVRDAPMGSESNHVPQRGVFQPLQSYADDKQCLEALDEESSRFWTRSGQGRELQTWRTVGMRVCDATKQTQGWQLSHDTTLINQAYPGLCLAPATLDGAVVNKNEHNYVALQPCLRASHDQRWTEVKSAAGVFFKNLANEDFALMQGNGTVIVESGAEAQKHHYLWNWGNPK